MRMCVLRDRRGKSPSFGKINQQRLEEKVIPAWRPRNFAELEVS